MNTIRASSLGSPCDQDLLKELANLQLELSGYPVRSLLDLFVSVPEHESANAFRLVDKCLSSWIALLDQPVDRVHAGLPEVFEQIELRQRVTRAALARVHATFVANPSRARAPSETMSVPK